MMTWSKESPTVGDLNFNLPAQTTAFILLAPCAYQQVLCMNLLATFFQLTRSVVVATTAFQPQNFNPNLYARSRHLVSTYLQLHLVRTFDHSARAYKEGPKLERRVGRDAQNVENMV